MLSCRYGQVSESLRNILVSESMPPWIKAGLEAKGDPTQY